MIHCFYLYWFVVVLIEFQFIILSKIVPKLEPYVLFISLSFKITSFLDKIWAPLAERLLTSLPLRGRLVRPRRFPSHISSIAKRVSRMFLVALAPICGK